MAAMEMGFVWIRRILRLNPLPTPPMATPLYENLGFYTFLKRQPNLLHRRLLSTATAPSPPGPVVSLGDASFDFGCVGSGDKVGTSKQGSKVLLKGMRYTELEV